MSLASASTHRPVFTVMVVLIVIILGGISLSRLPIDLMPDITYPTLSVETAYENASPEEIEELVTRPLEEALTAVPGVEDVVATSSEGRSDIRVTFSWGTNLDTAANDVRDRLDRVITRLPTDAERPSLRKFDLASFPVLILGAASKLDPIQMRRLIDEQVKYRIERVPGVASLDVRGGLNREIHVNLNADKIKALGLSLNQVLTRIRAGNVNLPAGSINRGNYEVTIRTPGEYANVEELRNTVIAERGATPVLLREVADVQDAWQRITQIVRVNGEPGIRLAVNKQSGTNSVEVARGVREELAKVNRDLPQLKVVPLMDTSKYIEDSIRNVGQSALFGGLLAIAVLLVFLRNLRSTAIIATAIPVSIVTTFGLMYFCGFTLNLMTLGGLALGVGMLVDNSIVVIENIYRLREEGQGRLAGAVNGAEEVMAPVIASTLTTVAVFLPLIFVRGMAGVMFRQLSYVIGFSLLCSLLVALTLVPMLAARLLQPTSLSATAHESLTHRAFRLSEQAFRGLESNYKALLHWALDHRLVIGILTLLAFGASLLLVRFIGTEMMPQADEGEVRVSVEMEAGTRLALLDEQLQRVEAVVAAAVPERKSLVVNTGGFHGGGAATGNLQLSLVSRAQRQRSSEQVAQDLRRRLANLPGMVIRVRASSGLFMFRRMAGSSDRLEVEVRGHDLETADLLARQVRKVVESVPGVTDARVSRDSGTPEELVVIDRRKAADLKLTVQQIAETLQTVLSGSSAGNYREAGDEYRIRVQVKDAERLALNEILDLTLANAAGEPVVLRNVVSVRSRRGPVNIERKNQERLITVSANLSDRDMGSVIADLRTQLRTVPVPRDFSIVISGDYEEQQKAFAELLLGFVLALILVYMVMACQYESLRDPFVVMFSVPLAAIGVILTLFLSNTTFNVQSFIGCIMLGGIVVNNAILLVDTTNLLRRRDGLPLRAAIEEAGRRRLRPILMTALTTILGLLPLALALGEGSEAQAPLARAVIGGLVSSTLITLVFIPVVYSFFESIHRRPAPAADATAAAAGQP